MLTPAERTLRAKIGAYSLHAQGGTNTGPARRAFLSKFEQEVDHDGVLSEQERQRRANCARKAHFARLGLKSAKKRKNKKPPKMRGLLRAWVDGPMAQGKVCENQNNNIDSFWQRGIGLCFALPLAAVSPPLQLQRAFDKRLARAGYLRSSPTYRVVVLLASSQHRPLSRPGVRRGGGGRGPEVRRSRDVGRVVFFPRFLRSRPLVAAWRLAGVLQGLNGMLPRFSVVFDRFIRVAIRFLGVTLVKFLCGFG